LSGGTDIAGRTPTGSGLRRVEAIFFEVAGLSPRDRDDAIVRLCAGDAALERDVRSLVRSAAKLGAFLEQPALGKQFDQLSDESRRYEAPDELIGAELGPFRIERRIASGGMGTVYLAGRSDGQFEQKVAIKVVKRGMDSEEVLRRFKAERQTLAGLDHPNIARLLDAGLTPDGRPFLVMEYVDGQPIDDYCDAKRLTVRERLKLFRHVCEGVQHAHQNLVIHRDIKPSNILVTSAGIPKLLDFGISRVLVGNGADTPATADTERRLTPEYASPEQVEGGLITTASDVYSLGVVLYELLTGTRPYHFNLRTHEEVRRVVCALVPLAPSEAVTVKVSRLRTGTPALGSEKPASSNGRGIDAARTPSTGPVPAPDAPKTRGVTSTRLRGQLRGDLDTIVLMALRKEPQRRYVSAEQLGGDIGRFLDGLPVQARKDTVVYRATKFVRRHAAGVGVTAAAMVLLSTATVMLYRQSQELIRQRDQLGASYVLLDAQEQEIRDQRDELLAGNHRLEENRRFLVAAIGAADTSEQGPDARLGDVLREAAAALAASPPADRLTRAAAEQSLGQAMMSLGMLAEARPLLEGAGAGFAALAETSDARIDARLDLAELLFYEGKPELAEAEFRSLLAGERARAGGGVTAREGTLLTNLGATLRAQRRVEEALAVQREALRVRAEVHGEQSLPVAEARNNLASALFQSGEVGAAVEEYERVLAVRRARLRADHPLVVRCESNLGLAKLRADDAEGALPLLSGAVERWDRAFGPEHSGRIAAMKSLAQAYCKLQRFDEGLACLGWALEWQRARLPEESPQIAATQANIGIALADKGDPAGAIDVLAVALPRLQGAAGVATIARTAAETLARLYDQAGLADKAREVREGAEGR
jgi:serine/threonine protein kinase/tetratricopeptide (TPR) repeat protein